MTLPDFVTGLELELRLRGVAFERRDLETFAADLWPLAEEDPDPKPWAGAFLEARQQAVGERRCPFFSK